MMVDHWREILVGGKKYVPCKVEKEMCMEVWHLGQVVPSEGLPACHHQGKFTRAQVLNRSRHANFPISLVLGCAPSVHWNYFWHKWPPWWQILTYLLAFLTVFQIATRKLILVSHKHLNINTPQTGLIILLYELLIRNSQSQTIYLSLPAQ